MDKDPNKQPIVEMAIDGEDVAGNAAHYFHKPFFVIFNLQLVEILRGSGISIMLRL
jgi:hypothetical protein